jgi:hypothetical protein
MTVLLYILASLLVLNAALLLFSVNGAKEMFRRPIRKLRETQVPSIMERKIPQAEYKKAV